MTRLSLLPTALGLSATLGLAAPASATDPPTFHDVRVAIVHTDADRSDETNTRIALFEQCFRTARYAVQIEHSQDPTDVLNENIQIAIAIGGSFRKHADLPFVVTIYWRPDGKRWDPNGKVVITGAGASDKAVESAALECIRHIEDKLQDALALHRLQHQRESRDLLLDQALTAFREQDYEQAAERAKSLLDADPNREQRYRAHFIVGHYYSQTHNYDEALRAFGAADELSDGDDSALLELGNVELHRNNHANALRYYKQVIDGGGVNAVKARWNLVLLYHGQGRLDEANGELRKLPERSVHTWTRSQLEGLVLTSLRERDELANQQATRQANRARVLGYLWRVLIGTALLVVGVLIATLYRRTQRDPSFTKEQRADAVGKLITGLFSILSLLAGTMVGLLIAK